MSAPAIITINRLQLARAPLARLCRHLEHGRPVILPTETQYALTCDATDPVAVESIRTIKGRGNQPFSVFLPDRAALGRWRVVPPTWAEPLIEAFWPGPLTLVLPTRLRVFSLLGGIVGAVGVRVSSEPYVSAITRRFGRPLLATSANRSGMQLDPAAENRWLSRLTGDRPVLWARPGRYQRRPASTVIDCTGDRPRLLRDGAIPRTVWRAVLYK
jgi:L-threonylcarbamoyladenylate synthase